MDVSVQRQLSSRSVASVGLVVVAAATFLFSVQLLSTATRSLAPAVRPLLSGWQGSLSLLGVSWQLAYVLLNGSVVAAISLSLFGAGIVTVLELFLLVAGSRLGAAGIVLLVGALDFLRVPEYSVPEALRLGTLTFLVSHMVYVPATVLGVAVIRWTDRDVEAAGFDVALPFGGGFLDPVTTAVLDLLGAAPSALLALLLFLGSLYLLDRVVKRLEADRIQAGISVVLRDRWRSLTVGLVLTAATTSVAFSMGVVVPLYNRELIRRREIVPYIMGASIGTLTDTLLVALVLESGIRVAVVLLLAGTAAACTLLALVFFEVYFGVVDALQGRLLTSRRAFAAFLVSLVAVPVVLVLVPV